MKELDISKIIKISDEPTKKIKFEDEGIHNQLVKVEKKKSYRKGKKEQMQKDEEI